MAKKPAKPKQTIAFEESLWDSANKLRGSVESSKYKHFANPSHWALHRIAYWLHYRPKAQTLHKATILPEVGWK
ncbi:hypothetical protein [Microbulbifer spongiae]|uniref:Site-specific DNA-methyltransferase (adenine-specific) n=1 Tax=Microbulbifer spongiae TaxID=2944933 RepID=A0ABY9E8B3_9GAMM|nr:hypothetical protein [Microbulbifer sp. MI-G]WKD48912.1 hypothetical protein M8T91_13550 [Microbulbifer sp. MI-G]